MCTSGHFFLSMTLEFPSFQKDWVTPPHLLRHTGDAGDAEGPQERLGHTPPISASTSQKHHDKEMQDEEKVTH